MEKQEFSFLSADGKTSIHAAVWIPAVPVRAIVEVSHGVSEHILRYESLAAYLTERGFAVIGHDHLGHGSSVIPGAPACTWALRAVGKPPPATLTPAGVWPGSDLAACPFFCWDIPWGLSWHGPT